MRQLLNRDYQAMASMIFGDVPKFSAVLETIEALEKKINQ